METTTQQNYFETLLYSNFNNNEYETELGKYLIENGYLIKKSYDFRSIFKPIYETEYDFKMFHLDYDRYYCFRCSQNPYYSTNYEYIRKYSNGSDIKPFTNDNEFHFSLSLENTISNKSINVGKNIYEDIEKFENLMNSIDKSNTDRVYDIIRVFLHPQNKMNMLDMIKLKNPKSIQSHICFILDLLEFNINIISNTKLDKVFIERDTHIYNKYEEYCDKLLEDYDILTYEKLLEERFIDIIDYSISGLESQVYQLIVIDKLITMSYIILDKYSYYRKRLDKLLTHFRIFLNDDHNKRQLKYYYNIDIDDNIDSLFKSIHIETHLMRKLTTESKCVENTTETQKQEPEDELENEFLLFLDNIQSPTKKEKQDYRSKEFVYIEEPFLEFNQMPKHIEDNIELI